MSSILIPTCHLRTVVSRVGSYESKRLQQKMMDSVNGQTVWIDIPEVYEEDIVLTPEELESHRRYNEWKVQLLLSSA